MTENEQYCYRILKTYSLVVYFEGQARRKNVPAPVEGETFGAWKNRVLGDSATNVMVYLPGYPAANKRISSLQFEANADHIKNTFSELLSEKNRQHRDDVDMVIEQTTVKVERSLTSFPKDTLEGILAAIGDELQPSVREFFDRYLESSQPDVDTEVMLRDLIRTYNDVVRAFRIAKVSAA